MKTSRSFKWRFGKALVFASVLCLGLAYTSGAFADSYLTSGGGIDMRLFKPAVDSKGFFTVNASSILPHLNPSFGLVIDYGYGLFRLNADDGNELNPLTGKTLPDGTHIVEHGGWGVLHVNLGLFNWVVLGLQLPVGILSGGKIEGPSEEEYPGVDTSRFTDDDLILSWSTLKVNVTRMFLESPQRMQSILELMAKLDHLTLLYRKNEETEEMELHNH